MTEFNPDKGKYDEPTKWMLTRFETHGFTRIAEDPRKMAEEPRKNSAEDMNENIHRKETTNSAYGVMNSLFY